ncbi:hypothetical protein F0562_028768 [Nyssa sinensis]|uniref:Serine carboxypeptidase-like 18 n=1 Tax=Nyssa sinensis TaxID=561372 RepID=A0A5J5B163_9ASTE|nr:hypothetical protein F0562_028768 [Nyssa sinensis]
MWLCVLIPLLVLSKIAVSKSVISSLPGFPDDVQLFYYFTESERNPYDDPLLLWLTGGPGCSAFSGLVYEIGPLSFDYANSGGDLPSFVLNPYSWTKVANIIFLDAPVGTGFSYSRSWQGYNTSDILSTAHTYSFLRKWLVDHPKFLKNPLYVGGDSYSGIVVPIIVQEILKGNEVGYEPRMNLKGYLLGNPVTNSHDDINSRIPYAHRVSLISDEIYESTKRNCYGEYINIDPKNALCANDLQVVSECIENICRPHILEPKCPFFSPKPNALKWDQGLHEENLIELLLQSQLPSKRCRSYNYISSYIWASDRTVQNALHIREGTKNVWVRCNRSLSYTKDVPSSVNYHKNLTKHDLRALIYSGDHDMLIPHVGTEAWIKSLNLPIVSDWQPWFVDGQVAGFKMIYSNNKYSLTYATVKGAGHTAPEYKPEECLAMVDRWFAGFPL